MALGLALAMLSVSQAEAGDILRGGTPLGGGGGTGDSDGDADDGGGGGTKLMLQA